MAMTQTRSARRVSRVSRTVARELEQHAPGRAEAALREIAFVLQTARRLAATIREEQARAELSAN